MAMHTLRAASVLKDAGMVVENTVRDFKVTADEPKNLGGTNTGMNPVELLLSALGACQCMTARFFAKLHKIDLEEYRVEVEGDLDIKGFLRGDSGIRPGLQQIRTTVYVKARAPKEKIEELIALVESRCPVGETVTNGVSIQASHVIIGEH